MTRQKTILLVILSIMVSIVVMPASAVQNDKDNEKVPVLISFKGKANAELVRSHGGNVTHEYTIIPAAGVMSVDNLTE